MHLAVTIHTTSHRHLPLPPNANALANWPVACLALQARLCMPAMIESHITWDLVDAHPSHFTALLCEGSQFLLRPRFGLYRRMTSPTVAHFRHGDQFTRIAVRMARRTRLLQIRDVQFMIELDRLLRSRASPAAAACNSANSSRPVTNFPPASALPYNPPIASPAPKSSRSGSATLRT